MPEALPCDGVNTPRGLIQEEDAGIVDKSRGQAQLLLHPAREFVRPAAAELAQADKLQHLHRARQPAIGGQAADLGKETQVLENRHLSVQAEALWQVANLASGPLKLVPQVESRQLHLARLRPEGAAQQTHRRRLAGAVRAHQGVDFASLDRQ